MTRALMMRRLPALCVLAMLVASSVMLAQGRGGVRRGLLGQGSILTVTSHPDRTSPVVRGK